MLVKAGAPVEATIDLLMPLLDKGDIIIDGGNEWYENTEHRQKKVAEKGLMYLGMGVSGGEEGARNGERSTALHSQWSAHLDRTSILGHVFESQYAISEQHIVHWSQLQFLQCCSKTVCLSLESKAGRAASC